MTNASKFLNNADKIHALTSIRANILNKGRKNGPNKIRILSNTKAEKYEKSDKPHVLSGRISNLDP
jgi:hypothetical protein